jgi:subtilase family serine protease
VAGLCGAVLVLWLGGAAKGAPDPGCTVPALRPPPCADLVPGRVRAQVVDDGRRLQITDNVANQGTIDSPETTLQVAIGNEALPAERLSPVSVKDSVLLTLTEAIPNELRGSGQAVTLTVDPANTVPELEESNNLARTKVFLPALPDLVITSATERVANGGKAIDVQMVVDNEGSSDAKVATVVEIAANGVSRTATLPALSVGASSTVKATLPVPGRARVGAVTATLTVDPHDLIAEEDETNNDFSTKPVTIAPDLSIGPVGETRRANFVILRVRVQNTRQHGGRDHARPCFGS